VSQRGEPGSSAGMVRRMSAAYHSRLDADRYDTVSRTAAGPGWVARYAANALSATIAALVALRRPRRGVQQVGNGRPDRRLRPARPRHGADGQADQRSRRDVFDPDDPDAPARRRHRLNSTITATVNAACPAGKPIALLV